MISTNVFDVRTFTLSDLQGPCQAEKDDKFFGLTALIDGSVSAYGGIRLVGTKHFAFFNIKAGVSAPIRFHRLVSMGLAAAKRNGITPIYSICDEGAFVTARRWHTLLGFREVTEAERDDELRAIEASTNLNAWIKNDGF